MKLAYVHQLPLEIYPPATNALAIFSGHEGWEVRAWSSGCSKDLPTCAVTGVAIRRPDYPDPKCGSAQRFSGFLRWHLTVARELARWQPDAILSIEPHSALAVWIYFQIFRGTARLFIHHHEYYAPADFLGAGSRTSRICHHFEKSDLFRRAAWVSQTNEKRLFLMQADCHAVTAEKGRLWPNYPPGNWDGRSAAVRIERTPESASNPLQLICVGSLSFEDTFIREAVEWVAARPREMSLHVCGHNVKPDVWQWIEALNLPNITTQPTGCGYDELPELLPLFDVALVLYKGNTLNFIHNVPNKAVEALACGLEVWYPLQMEGMRNFSQNNPRLPIRMLDFRHLPLEVPAVAMVSTTCDMSLTCEESIKPLMSVLRKI